MEDFYDRVLQIKKMHRLNNQQLGDVIGLSGDAFRMALKRESFSALQIRYSGQNRPL